MRAQADAARQSDWDSVSGCGGRRSAVTDWHMLALYLSPENGLLYRDGSVLKRPRDLHLSCFSLSISSHLALCSISLLLLLSSKTATSPLGEAVTQLSHSRKPNLPSLLVLKREGENHLQQLFMTGKKSLTKTELYILDNTIQVQEEQQQ